LVLFLLPLFSSDLWVPSSNCPKSNCPNTRFSESESSSLKQTKQIFAIQYGSGAANGTYAYDTITVQNNITAQNQIFGLATSTSGMSQGTASDKPSGILGLGFSSLMRSSSSNPNDPPFILNLLANKVINQPVFSIYLNKQANYGYTGEIILGGYDTDRFHGDLSFVPLVTYDGSSTPLVGDAATKTGEYRYWTVPGQGVRVYNSSNSVYQSQYPDLQPAILDTGTTLSYLPTDMALGVLKSITSDYKSLPLNGGTIPAYQVSCSLAESDVWLDFQFSTSLTIFTVNPVLITVPLNELILPIDGKTEECMFGIAPSSDSFKASVGSGWILGQTVLRSAYVVHDMSNYQVAIGAAANGYYSLDHQESNRSSQLRPGYCLLLLVIYPFLVLL
jgi:hypothetical protein